MSTIIHQPPHLREASDTIFALSTAPGKAGVAIIRVSGSQAESTIRALSGPTPEHRVASLRTLKTPQTGEIIDQALVLYFQAPQSFTGEDVAEFHIHGSRAVILHMLEVLGGLPGLRMAGPGEFTKRAFIHGQMDLTQVEGLSDLIEAETRVQQKVALRQMKGELHELYQSWRKKLIEAMAQLEAFIDFPDEDLPEDLTNKLTNDIANLQEAVRGHLHDGRKGERLRDGLYVAIIGAPNVGKSSLLNYLAQRDVAIVSHRAGTTRDVLDIHLDIGGFPLMLADTAGLRETTDDIEIEGIRRARERVDMADYTIALFDATTPTPDSETLALVDDDTICVFNKVDLCDTPPTLEGREAIAVSIKEKEGLHHLMDALQQKAEAMMMPSHAPMITRQRHRQALTHCLDALDMFTLDKPIELAGEDLRHAAHQLGSIIGVIGVEDILDELFQTFCIGK